MFVKRAHITLILIITFFGLALNSNAQSYLDIPHNKVAIRLIGHEILLQSGDSTSRVLPIDVSESTYKIQFENDFTFEAEQLNSTIAKVISDTKISNNYIVEVKDCENNEVVYSYEIGFEKTSDILPCKGRKTPKGCYYILINILDSKPVTQTESITDHQEEESSDILFFIMSFVPIFITLGVFLIKKKKPEQYKENLISIGDFLFDKRNMQLIIKEVQIELTGKESDLLDLLYQNVNNTVERETLLKNVWGDDGDYIGRTLDVYISKLRKKLESDESIKIINVRGIGYKLILNIS